MVAEVQNTTVTVLRGTTVNDYGDTVDSDTPVFSGLPACLTETGKTVQDPSTTSPRTIRQVQCIVPQYAAVVNTDQVVDESTGQKYMVIGVTMPPTLMGAPVDTVLDLKRVTAATT